MKSLSRVNKESKRIGGVVLVMVSVGVRSRQPAMPDQDLILIKEGLCCNAAA